MNKILLAYSGGLDTSVILAWLQETYKVPIVAYCANVGQKEDFQAVQAKASQTGAEKCVVDDLRLEFAKEYILPTIKANCIYEGVYLMGTALARPCIAKGMIEAAMKEGCDAIAHGATGKGNDQVRFELAAKSLAPHLKLIAPWREWDLNGRNELFAYAEKRGIPLPVTRNKPYSIDANLMHSSYEGGILEDPWAEASPDIYLWTTDPEKAPDKPQYVEVTFEHGVPTAIDGRKLDPLSIVQVANDMGAIHGVGRVDLVENRYIGIKSRGIYETPGVTILMQAHRAVESLTLDREVAHLKEQLALKLADLTYNGYWFAPEAELLRKTVDETQGNVTGVAKLKLYKGSCQVVARKAENSLYSKHLVSFDDMQAFQPSDSGGFININGLRLQNWSQTYGSFEKGIQSRVGSPCK
jgi:argininosuccinate synthase